jgi:short-subunit dehydrogenase
MISLILGGGSGIGFESARILARRGYEIVLSGRSMDRLNLASDTIEKESGARPLCISCDIGKIDSVRQLKEELISRSICPDVIINAAGFGTIGYFLDNDADKERAETETNSIGTLNVMHEFLPMLTERDRGFFVNVASSAGYMPGSPGMAVYYATKSYCLSLTRSVAEELKMSGSHVTLSALCPGPVQTGFSKKAGGNDEYGPFAISAETCARALVNGMFKKKKVIVPGFFMKFTLPAAKILPAGLLLMIAGMHQKRKLSIKSNF